MFDAIYQVLFFLLSLIPLFSFENIFENDLLNKLLHYLLIAVVISVIKISKRISIHNGVVEKDIHMLFLGSIKTIQRFPISEIEEIYLNQNEERYFEISTKRKHGPDFIFSTLPNKNPALKQLEVIKAHFKFT